MALREIPKDHISTHTHTNHTKHGRSMMGIQYDSMLTVLITPLFLSLLVLQEFLDGFLPKPTFQDAEGMLA